MSLFFLCYNTRMSKTNIEKSCGAVIFDSRKKDARVLIIRQLAGHYCFVKGHMEVHETEADTALREIKEETGLEVKLDTKFSQKTHYFLPNGNEKENTYFIAYVSGGKEHMEKDELSHMYWMKPIEALGCITYDNDAELLKQAMKYRKAPW